MNSVHLFILISAVWRLSSLFANEEGAFGMFEKLRSKARRLTVSNRLAKAFHLSQGLECEWCNSVWFATPIAAAWYVFGDIVAWVLLPLALSTWAIVLKYIVQTLQQLHEYAELRVSDHKVERLVERM